MDYSKFEKIVEADDAEKEEKKALEQDLEQAKEAINKARELHGIKATVDDSDSDDSDLEECPLFWTKPPSSRKNPSSKALQMEEILSNMVYEDKSPKALANDFKERGNLAFKQNQSNEAMNLYSEALQWAHKAWTAEDDMSQVIAAILSNRAAVQLKRKNFRSAIKEAEASLRASSTGTSSSKARFRGAKACLELHRPEEALRKFLSGISETLSEKQQLVIRAVDTDDEETRKNKEKLLLEATELAQLVKTAKNMQAKLLAIERQKQQQLIQEKREDSQWRERFAKHGVRIGPLTMDLQAFTGGAEKAGGRGPYPRISEEGDWLWPCLIMYPEYSQSDFVEAFNERNSLEEVLNTMFPPVAPALAPWDERQAYVVPELEVYFRERAAMPFDLTRPLLSQSKDLAELEENDVRTRRWFKVPLTATLGQVLASPNYVIPGIPLFVVISKKSSKYHQLFLESCRQKDGPVVPLKL